VPKPDIDPDAPLAEQVEKLMMFFRRCVQTGEPFEINLGFNPKLAAWLLANDKHSKPPPGTKLS
jgi:hypothetical protein